MEDINTLMDQFGNELNDKEYELLLDTLSAFRSAMMTESEFNEIVRDFMDFSKIEELLKLIRDEYE